VATPEPAEQGKTLTLREAIREAARCLPEPFTKQEILNWVTAHAASTLAGAGKSTFGSAICQLRAIGSLADAGERDGEVAFKAGNGLGRK
jgi:hypothetical protein